MRRAAIAAALARRSRYIRRSRFFCSFEVNAAFEARWLHAGVRFGARGIDGEPRALELPVHRFFVTTLFQPQQLELSVSAPVRLGLSSRVFAALTTPSQ